MPSYFETRQLIAQGLAEKEVKVKERKPLPKATKPIAKRSEKMKGIFSALVVLYEKFLKGKTECRLKTPVCTGRPEVVHHTKGRGVKVILDQDYWLEACSACNLYVENKDQEAREAGNKVSRHAK